MRAFPFRRQTYRWTVPLEATCEAETTKTWALPRYRSSPSCQPGGSLARIDSAVRDPGLEIADHLWVKMGLGGLSEISSLRHNRGPRFTANLPRGPRIQAQVPLRLCRLKRVALVATLDKHRSNPRLKEFYLGSLVRSDGPCEQKKDKRKPVHNQVAGICSCIGRTWHFLIANQRQN